MGKCMDGVMNKRVLKTFIVIPKITMNNYL